MKIEGAIFDLDGTLLDSMGIWKDLGKRYLKKHDIVAEKNLNHVLRTMSQQQAAEYFIQEYGLEKPVEDIVQDNVAIVEDFYRFEVDLKPGVRQTIKKMYSLNIPMCIATASDRILVELSLERLDMLKYFDKIFTCNEVGQGKDDPLIFLEALDFLNTEKSNIYIFEDAYHAIETAKNADFPVIAVREENEMLNREKIKEISDYYINSFYELGDCFE